MSWLAPHIVYNISFNCNNIIIVVSIVIVVVIIIIINDFVFFIFSFFLLFFFFNYHHCAPDPKNNRTLLLNNFTSVRLLYTYKIFKYNKDSLFHGRSWYWGDFCPLRDFIRINVYYCITLLAAAWERFECSYIHTSNRSSNHIYPGPCQPILHTYIYIYIYTQYRVFRIIYGCILLYLEKYEKIYKKYFV